MAAQGVCRACSATPRDNARFCDSCGAALDAVDRHAEYKQVTIVFADVVGSMDIAAAVGAERLREIMGDIFDLCAAVVKRFGGTVDKFTGDGIMALFGAPKALEDHAFRACLAALEIQRKFGELGIEPQPRLRIGLNSGEVIAGEISSSASAYTAVGEEVGLAQRMESVAPPGGVMLSESTARLVNDRASMSTPEMVHIKGRPAPISARLLLSTDQNTPRLQHDPELVGRAWELNAVAAMIADVTSGGGCVIEVVGSPGIGKSRLIQEAGAIAESHHIEVFTAHCESHTTEIPFRAVTGLLRSVFRVGNLDDVAARMAIRATLAGADDTDIALLHDLLGIRETGAGPVEVAPDARRRRLASLLNTAALARAEPAVIVVEDVHWIDPPSEAMLADFASVLLQTRIIMLVTYRPEYNGTLTQTPGSQKISLVPLRPSHTFALLDALIGTHASTTALKMRIAERADGNPFFAQEMIRDLVERSVLGGSFGALVCQQDSATIGVPATLQSTIAARIDRLGDRSKRTLNAAAVIGTRFDARFLQKMLDAGDIDMTEAVRADLLEQVAYSPRAEYAFRHPLIRTVAYESQLRSDRSELHRRAAAVIEGDAPDAPDRTAALIAEHREAAGDLVAAFTWHMRTGDWLAARDIDAARASWRRARDLADSLAPDTEGRAAMRIAARLPLTGSAWRVGAAVSETGYEELRALAIESDDRTALAVAMLGQAAQLGLHEQLSAALALGQELLELADSIDDVDVTSGSLSIVMYATYQTGQMDTLLALSQRLIDIADGDPTKGSRYTNSPLPIAMVLRGIARCAKGIPGWRDDFATASVLSTPDPAALAVVTTYRFAFGIPAGALAADAAALEETARVLRIAERFGEDFTLASARLSHGIALIHHEDALREEGFKYLALACDAALRDRFLMSAVPMADLQAARKRLHAGDVDGAIDLVRSTAAEVFGSGNAIITPQATTVLVEALIRRSADGDLAAAGAAVDRLAATASGYTFEELPLLRQRALLARAHGDESAYRDFRDRYRAMANELGFEGHIALGEAMD